MTSHGCEPLVAAIATLGGSGALKTFVGLCLKELLSAMTSDYDVYLRVTKLTRLLC